MECPNLKECRKKVTALHYYMYCSSEKWKCCPHIKDEVREPREWYKLEFGDEPV